MRLCHSGHIEKLHWKKVEKELKKHSPEGVGEEPPEREEELPDALPKGLSGRGGLGWNETKYEN